MAQVSDQRVEQATAERTTGNSERNGHMSLSALGDAMAGYHGGSMVAAYDEDEEFSKHSNLFLRG